MKIVLLSLICILYLPLFASNYDEVRNLNISAVDISRLKIDCGAGYLKIIGKENTDQIYVTAKIEARNIAQDRIQTILEKYLELSLKKKGRMAELISTVDKSKSLFSLILHPTQNIIIDLKVEIPREMDVVVDDGSGYIEVRHVNGEIRVDDGSGYIDISDSKGNIEIDDGSGDITIQEIDGKIELDDGSGDISIKKSKSKIRVDDGSGDIYIYNIQGDVTIDDGTGEMVLNEIEGEVRVDDGSGSIMIDGIEKDVIIENSGSGNVKIRNVAGYVHRYDD